MRILHMFKHFETKDAIELEEKIKSTIEFMTVHSIDPRVIDILRKELESLSIVTSDIEDSMVIRTVQEIATLGEAVSCKWV